MHYIYCMQTALFNNTQQSIQPLAEKLRPSTLNDIIGQDHLVGDGASLRILAESKTLPSLVLWGPPGCGKTTLARILAKTSGHHFESLSAIMSGVGDLRKVFDVAKSRASDGHKTLLFIDEIHRFNKSQQDAFLPYVEDGTILLIGATTENPSFELNAALLSRASVYVLNRLDMDALETILKKIESTIAPLPLLDDARTSLKAMADGDGRHLINMTEQILAANISDPIDTITLTNLVQKRSAIYDKSDEGHYNLISALHKSVRGSDPDAALYWFCRMLEGGEDPKFLARRITRMATEDIGLASPQALSLCNAAWETYERLGTPEGELALAEALIYLATAPKSNAVYTAFKNAKQFAKENGSLMPPKHILNAPTSFMQDQGYGKGYLYDHDIENEFSGQNYFPDDIKRHVFYTPKGNGFEKGIKERLEEWHELRKQKSRSS